MIKSFHANLSAQVAKTHFALARSPHVPDAFIAELLRRGIAYGQSAGHPGTLQASMRGWKIEPPSDFAAQIEEFASEATAESVTWGEAQPAGIYRLKLHGEIFGLPPGFEARITRCHQVTIDIDSIGGDGLAAWTMIERLKDRGVTTHISGLALSSGALISQIGIVRTMAPNARMMIHGPQRALIGNAEKLIEAAKDLALETAKDIDFFAWRTGQPVDLVAQWFDGNDHWFTAEQALAAGLVDAIRDNENKS